MTVVDDPDKNNEFIKKARLYDNEKTKNDL
jgi:hypothetical protein